MADSKHQQVLSHAWLHSREGTLCAREQAKAWALREMWKDQARGMHGVFEFVAERVLKSGGNGHPTPRNGHPTPQAVSDFFKRIDSDTQWFPGKRNPDNLKPGPTPLLRGVKRKAIAEAAMAIKRRGGEPTYAGVVAACPTAAINPNTNKPFTPKYIYAVIAHDCFDDGPEAPWVHKARYSKAALTEDNQKKRHAFGLHMQSLNHRESWFYQHIVWTDLCNSIRALTEAKEKELALARKGKKGWTSPGCEMQNLRGNTMVLKMCVHGTQNASGGLPS